ncbi:MAG: HI0074 family nucleotidyltransferase substrate-binding subunit [Chloroflexota bacterium]
MTTAPNLNDVTRILQEFLPAHYGAVLFGSRATGRARPESDWDIGVLGPEPLSGKVVETIREELDELPTLHTFDVVDLVRAPEQLQRSALRGARTIVPAAVLEKLAEVMAMTVNDEIDLAAFEAALKRLRDALAEPKSDVVRDAAIQRFEFSFELAWKTAMRVMRKAGVESGAAPKQIIRAAFKMGWIADDGLWLDMLDARNRTSHIYNEEMADEIFAHLPGYHAALAGLLERLKQELQS